MDADHVTPMDTVSAGIHIIPTDIKDGIVCCGISPYRTVRSVLTKFHANVFIRVLSVFLCGRGFVMGQTSIVVLKDDAHIIVAADSKLYNSTSPICKIHQSGNIFWAVAGLMDDSESGYHLGALAESSIREGTTIPNALAYFMKASPSRLKKEMVYVRKAHPDWYDTLSVEIGGLAIAFFGIEKGKPVMAFVNYEKDGDGVSVTDKGVFGQCPNNARVCGELLGKKAAGMAYMSAHPEWGNGDLTETVKKIVNLEIAEAPDFVGPPISVLRVGESGTFWIDQNNCPDIKKIPQPKPREQCVGKKPH